MNPKRIIVNEILLYHFELSSTIYKNMFEKMADLEMINKLNGSRHVPYRIGV